MEDATAAGSTRHQCAHSACICTVDNDKTYCSDYCAKAAAAQLDEDDMPSCACGHAECDAP